MILSPKMFHRLASALARLRLTDDELARFLDLAKPPGYLDIPYVAPDWHIWRRILTNVENDKRAAVKLLEIIGEKKLCAEIFVPFIDEITSSRVIRQRKIKQALAEGRCVIFLGPDALKVRTPQNHVPFNDHVCNELASLMKGNYIYYSPKLADNLSYLAQCFADDPQAAPGEFASHAATTYNSLTGQFDNSLFDALAQLPIKLVINANPDSILLDRLHANGKTGAFTRYYDLSNQNADTVPFPGISQTTPFVYNIFGAFENVDSVLFTEAQFMDFINAIIQDGPELNSHVIREFVESDTYLFLGFDFEQWYFKILFQLFNIKKEDYASVSCGMDIIGQPQVGQAQQPDHRSVIYNREFFEQEFKIYFVNDDLTNFILETARIV